MSEDVAISGVHEVVISPPDQPGQEPALVVKWRRRGMVIEGLVTHEVDGRVVTEWLPAHAFEPGIPAAGLPAES